MEKKNTMLLTIIAVATLLVAVVGATFAYFTAQNGASGTTTATVTTETIGAITVSNEDPALYLDLTAAQMQEGVTGSYWATKIKGAEPATNYASADKAVIAKLNVSGGDETTTYSCNFKITVDKTDVTLAYGDAAVVFALENNAEILGVTSGSEIDYTTLLNEYTVNFTRVGDTEEDLPLVSVSMRVSNTEVEQGFAGETLTTTFTSSDLECEVVDESDVKTLSGTWKFNDVVSAIPYETIPFDWEDRTEMQPNIFNEYGFVISPIYSTVESVDIIVDGFTPLLTEADKADSEIFYDERVIVRFKAVDEATYGSDYYYVTFDSTLFQQYNEIEIISSMQNNAISNTWMLANAKPVIEVDELPTENIDTSAIYKTYEYMDIDSTDTTTLAAGTYRFNDVLSGSIDGSLELLFTTPSAYAEDGSLLIPEMTWNEIEIGLTSYGTFIYQNVVGDDESSTDITCYTTENGWNNIAVTANNDALEGYGQTITITEETGVFDEVYTWFIANAKLLGDAKYYQYIDGSWVEQ